MGARADFPSDSLEELNQLVGARDSIAKHLGEIRAEKEAALKRLSRAESERRELAAYASFADEFRGGTDNGVVCQLSQHLAAERRPAEDGNPPAKRSGRDGEAFGRAQPGIDGSGSRLAAHGARSCRGRTNRFAELRAASGKHRAREIKPFGCEPDDGIPENPGGRDVDFRGGIRVPQAIFPALTSYRKIWNWVLALAFAAVAAILLVAAAKSAKPGPIRSKMLSKLESELNSIRSEGGKKRRQLQRQ